MSRRLIKFFQDANVRRKEAQWEYGVVSSERLSSVKSARRHRKNGNVQFILYKAGQEGYSSDFWVDFDKYWWKFFKPTIVDKK